MTNKFILTTMMLTMLAGCHHIRGNQFVLLGESTIPGSSAVGEANVHIKNANANGCNAISVGGYGLGGASETGGSSLIGVPVLVDCPKGIDLLPNGTVAP
jgi:hypothetical protein